MNAVEWILLISLIIYVCIAALALKFPHVKADWGKERKETLYLALSVTVFLMLFFLLWYVSSVVDWPPALTVMVWAGAAALAFLTAVAIFMPHGIKLSFKKKVERVVEEED